MNHQPFETWLLDEQSLTNEQKRELDAHLRTCTHCTALAETRLALRAKRMASPVEGFTSRFQARLAAQRVLERRKRFWGSILFLLVGLALAAWISAPFVNEAARAPAQWITLILRYALFIVTSLQALVNVGHVLLEVVPAFIPPLVWGAVVLAAAGFGLLWTISIWRLTRVPQGA